MTRKEQPSPASRIPDFTSREEMAAWFDTHDMADYWDAFQPVKVRFAKNLSGQLTVRLDHTTLGKLRELALKKALSDVVGQYDLVFVDCPPALGLLTVNALVAADALLIPVQCEFYAMEGLGRLLKTVEMVRESLNPGLAIEGVVLTMFDGRNNLHKQVAEEIRKYFYENVFKTVIPRNITLAEAPSHGTPVLLYDVASTGAQAYLSLAKEVIRHAKKGAR